MVPPTKALFTSLSRYAGYGRRDSGVRVIKAASPELLPQHLSRWGYFVPKVDTNRLLPLGSAFHFIFCIPEKCNQNCIVTVCTFEPRHLPTAKKVIKGQSIQHKVSCKHILVIMTKTCLINGQQLQPDVDSDINETFKYAYFFSVKDIWKYIMFIIIFWLVSFRVWLIWNFWNSDIKFSSMYFYLLLSFFFLKKSSFSVPFSPLWRGDLRPSLPGSCSQYLPLPNEVISFLHQEWGNPTSTEGGGRIRTYNSWSTPQSGRQIHSATGSS